MRLALFALGLASCIAPGLVPCGDQVCPANATCVADALCASADQLAACADLSDGATCSLRGGVGACDRGVCVAAGCGNGVVDPGEACDDGNTASGDGCRSDCRKLEVCGDAMLDVGEGCDDGNTNPADGCDACVPTTWGATATIGGSVEATTVGLGQPNGVAVDRLGNLYIADYGSSRIRRVDTTGAETTVAGTGIFGFGGDGGAATSAQLAGPSAVAVDGLGNVYIADSLNSRVRKVDLSGTITTVAGTGAFGYNGDGIAATSALLANPYDIVVDGLGNLYIADSGNRRVRRVDGSKIITTIAGTGVYGSGGDGGPATSAQLQAASGITFDSHGNLYIADGHVRRVDTSGVITTVAGNGTNLSTGDGGLATSAGMAAADVAVDELGVMYIADATNCRIRRVDVGGIITTIAGTGTYGFNGDGAATSAQLADPFGIALDHIGGLYIADFFNSRVRYVDTSGSISTVAGTGAFGFNGDGGAATSAGLIYPGGVAVDGLGVIYIADPFGNRIRRVDLSGVITTVAGTGVTGFAGDGGMATQAQLHAPAGVAVDGSGNVYIADSDNMRIRRVDPTGVITTIAGDGTNGFSGDGGAATAAHLGVPAGVAVDQVGNVYIADTYNFRIRRVDASGMITTIAGTGTNGSSGDGGPATSAQIGGSLGVASDTSGNVYIADTSNHRIRKVDTNHVITSIAGTGTFGFSGDTGAATSARLAQPAAVAADALGNLYIADSNNQRVRRIDTTGVITTVAGGALGGDGGNATDASVYYPGGVAAGGGSIYIAEKYLRRVNAAGIITTVAGPIDPEGMGPLAQARLADPHAIVLTPSFTLFAGGSSGTVQVASSSWLVVGAGRYPMSIATGSLARFRDVTFGTISGIAYDVAGNVIYLTESSSNRLHVVTIVDPADVNTWTIATLANAAGVAGFGDGAAQTARFRDPTGLYFDPVAKLLYVADTGNHVIRAVDLSTGVAGAVVRTVAGVSETRGYFGDGGAAGAALLFAPRAFTRCANGDAFIADTGNHRVRRIAAGTGTISTVLGVGVGASSGDGSPATTFPVDAPLGLACDPAGNLLVTSTTTVRLVTADGSGNVDGSGIVETIYGAAPRDTFPASVTTCLTGLAIVDATTVDVTDSCTGLLVELHRRPK